MQGKTKEVIGCATPVLIEILGQLIVQGIAQFWFMYRFPSSDITELGKYGAELTVLTAILLIPVLWLFYRKDLKQSDVSGSLKKTLKAKSLFWEVMMAVSACILLNCIIVISGIQNMSESYMQTAEVLYSPPFEFQLIGLGMIVPVMEEFVFRLLMYKRMRRILDTKKSILLSAFIFGILHGNLVQFLFAFAIGILLAYSYEAAGHPVIPVAGHIAVNMTSLFLTQYHIFEWFFESGIKLTATIVVLTVAFIISLKKILDKI